MSTFDGYFFEASGSWIDPMQLDQSKTAIKREVGLLLPPRPNCQFPPKGNKDESALVMVDRGLEMRRENFFGRVHELLQCVSHFVHLTGMRYGVSEKWLRESSLPHDVPSQTSAFFTAEYFNLVRCTKLMADYMPHVLRRVSIEQADKDVCVEVLSYASTVRGDLEEVLGGYSGISWDERKWKA